MALLAGCGTSGGTNADQFPEPAMMLPPEEDARANIAVAQSLETGGNDREAISHYERARNLQPSSYQWVCRRLAVLYDRVGDTYRAEREYQKAYRLQPNDADLLNDMGFFYYQRERYAEAEDKLRRSVEADPNHTRAWNNLGLTLAWTGRTEEAYNAFINAVSPAEANANLGVVLAQQGRYEEAELRLERAMRQQPDLQRYQSVLDAIRKERSEAAPASAGG
jgi:Tfp pilus assembly protein PilF